MLSLRGLRNTHVSDAIHEEMRREGVSEEEFFKEVSKIKDNSAPQGPPLDGILYCYDMNICSTFHVAIIWQISLRITNTWKTAYPMSV